MKLFRIGMAQMNPTVGDLDHNVRTITGWLKEARKAGADVVAFPEMAITGYPPEDLVLKQSFLRDTRRALGQVKKFCQGIVAIVGFVEEGGKVKPRSDIPAIVPSGHIEIYNAAAIIADCHLVATYAKKFLPNYGVFDESRYFYPGKSIPVFVVNGTVFGVNICEDIWYPEGPTRLQALIGRADLIVNINASPFQWGKSEFREQMLRTRAKENGVILSYTNTVGGQDELVFDGNSLLIDQTGEILLRGKAFEEELLIADLNMGSIAQKRTRLPSKIRGSDRSSSVKRVVISQRYVPRARPSRRGHSVTKISPLEEVYRALVVGVRDYVKKNRFRKVLIGLSGGVDSALTAVIAKDALGAANVQAIFMPSTYTSRESAEDAVNLASNLGIHLLQIPITRVFHSYLKLFQSAFQGTSRDTTEENLQARIRGNILMALSNKFGHLVLTTGNKSEMSVGYATLYGDMAGGFAVIKDVPKTLVYELAQWRNGVVRTKTAAVIPQRIIDRPPSAELKPGQLDQDTLPPYPILDAILKAYVEEDQSFEEIVRMGFEKAMIRRVLNMVDRSEYKRRQAPLGIKITQRALGKDRRMPITNRYPTY